MENGGWRWCRWRSSSIFTRIEWACAPFEVAFPQLLPVPSIPFQLVLPFLRWEKNQSNWYIFHIKYYNSMNSWRVSDLFEKYNSYPLAMKTSRNVSSLGEKWLNCQHCSKCNAAGLLLTDLRGGEEREWCKEGASSMLVSGCRMQHP